MFKTQQIFKIQFIQSTKPAQHLFILLCSYNLPHYLQILNSKSICMWRKSQISKYILSQASCNNVYCISLHIYVRYHTCWLSHTDKYSTYCIVCMISVFAPPIPQKCMNRYSTIFLERKKMQAVPSFLSSECVPMATNL